MGKEERSPAEPESTGPAAKRSRLIPPTSLSESDVLSVFGNGLFKQDRKKLADDFATSKPYLHSVIDGFGDDALLRSVRKEIMSALHFTVKETDIYKVHQTGDLANLDGLPADELSQLQSLFRLRNALYSPQFRKYLADVTRCGPLSGSKTDMSINTYARGCHLLNHDDVIGTRRVSYILYLPDPDERWDPTYGGALELYPVLSTGTPAVAPTVTIPPKWNQFVMFTVQPGHSFHSVEEVVVDKPRLSISGWFHVPQEGEPGYNATENAAPTEGPKFADSSAPSSLEQLSAGASMPFTAYKDVDEENETSMLGLSEEDIVSLSKWLNPRYLDMKVLGQVSEKFLEESSIQLVEFLNEDLLTRLKTVIEDDDKKCGLLEPNIPKHGVGEDGDWIVAGPPHKFRYVALSSELKTPISGGSSSGIFGDLVNELFSQLPFRRWLTLVTQLAPQSYRGVARRFRPGLDYTLAWSSDAQVLDATLCFATSPNAVARDAWESDEVGGYECYMAPHDGEEDPAVYQQMDDDGALLTVSAGWNVLTLVLRDEGLMKFIKYVSALAPGSRWDVAFEYELPPSDGSDQSDED